MPATTVTHAEAVATQVAASAPAICDPRREGRPYVYGRLLRVGDDLVFGRTPHRIDAIEPLPPMDGVGGLGGRMRLVSVETDGFRWSLVTWDDQDVLVTVGTRRAVEARIAGDQMSASTPPGAHGEAGETAAPASPPSDEPCSPAPGEVETLAVGAAAPSPVIHGVVDDEDPAPTVYGQMLRAGDEVVMRPSAQPSRIERIEHAGGAPPRRPRAPRVLRHPPVTAEEPSPERATSGGSRAGRAERTGP